MSSPAPCREPEEHLDFALKGLPEGQETSDLLEEPTEGNKGDWSCENRQVRSINMDRTAGKFDLPVFSRQETFLVVDGETFAVEDPTPPSDHFCSTAGSSSPCYPLCCDSAYAQTEFCSNAYCF